MVDEQILLAVIAEWCVNLSAGWFGAAFIVPATARRPLAINERVVLEDIVLALAFILAAYILRSI